MSTFFKPILPVLNRRHPLVRSGLAFANATGWSKGATNLTAAFDRDNITLEAGRLNTVPTDFSAGFGITELGRGVSLGNLDSGANWPGIVARTVNSGPSGQISVAVLYGTSQVASNKVVVMKGDKFRPTNGYQFGFRSNAPDRMQFETSTGGMSNAIIDPETIVSGQATFHAVTAAGGASNDMVLIRDGALATVKLGGGAPAAFNTDKLFLFADESNKNFFDGALGMILIWNRLLPPAAFVKLAADPYSPWKTALPQQYMFGAFSALTPGNPGGTTVGISRKFTKPILPILNRRHPLRNGLVFANPVGYARGYFAPSGNLVETDDITKRRGDIITSFEDVHEKQDIGWCISNGSTPDANQWDGPVIDKANPGPTGQTTSMVLYRPKTPLPGSADKTTYMKGDGGFFPASGGWTFRFRGSIGIINRQNYTLSANNQTNDPEVVTIAKSVFYGGTAAGGTGAGENRYELYRDGAFAIGNTPGTADPTVDNIGPVSLCGADDNTAIMNCAIGMTAIWKIRLPNRAHSQMFIDPYSLWKDPAPRRFMWGFGLLDAPGMSYFLLF